ncbi:hypothetical protein Tco_0213514, partial [Tanacetum coccineum]
MDKSWMRTSRTKKQYIDGVEAFIKYAVHNLQKMRNIDPREFVDDTDFDMDFGSEIPTYGPAIVKMVNATKESFDDLAKFQELLLDAEKPLYKGCPDFTKLSAIVKLLNLKGKYGASDKNLLTHHPMIHLSLRKIDALEKDKLAQATEILCLKKRVEKLEKRRKSKPSVLRRLRKIGFATRISLVDETQRLDDDLIFDTTADLGGEEVVVKPAKTSVSPALDVEVSAVEPAVTTISSLVTTDSVTITAVEPVSAAAKELTDNDMTMAKGLAELKTSKPKVVTTVPSLNSATTVITTKPKAKGITIQEPSVTQKTTVSFISSSKGKAIMIESEKPMKIKDQIAHDEQVATDLHDKIQVELEEEAKRKEEASMATIAKLYDVVQAHIYADQELVARMTLEEHEKYTVEDRARMLAEFIKNRKKQLAVEKAKAIKSKPPTKLQLRNLMMTYLKNTGRFTHAQQKNREFEEIQGVYNKEKELVDTFVPIGSEEDKRRIKELNTKAEEESNNKDVDSTNKRKKRIQMKRSSKKQKTDVDLKAKEQLKTFLSIVPNEEEAINCEVLDKRYQIVDWKSEFIMMIDMENLMTITEFLELMEVQDIS